MSNYTTDMGPLDFKALTEQFLEDLGKVTVPEARAATAEYYLRLAYTYAENHAWWIAQEEERLAKMQKE